MTFYKYCGDLEWKQFAGSWAVSAICEHTGEPVLHWVLCLELSAGTSGGKHLWEAQLFCGLNSEAQNRGAYGDIPYPNWADVAVCCFLLSVTLGAWSCLQPALYLVWSLAELTMPAEEQPSWEEGRGTRSVRLSQTALENKAQICSEHQGWTAYNLL